MLSLNLFGEGSVGSSDGRMLLPKVCPIGESFNNNPTHLHGGSDAANDHVSDVHIGDVIVEGVTIPSDVDVVVSLSGTVAGIRPYPYFYLISLLSSSLSWLNLVMLIAHMSCLLSLAMKVSVYLCIFFLCETHFMYMYSSFFSILHLIVPFDKFKVNVLRELNISLTQLHLNAWAAMCAFRVLCNVFSIILPAPNFLHHYTVKENKKGGWISSLVFIVRRSLDIIPPLINTLRVFFFLEYVLVPNPCPFTLLGRWFLGFLFIGLRPLQNLGL